MRTSEKVAAGVVRTWTRIYTAGVTAAARDRRRAEIDSDVWEHVRAGSDATWRPRATARQILARWFLGIGADLSWRAHVSLPGSRIKREEAMAQRIRRNWWIPAPLAMIAFGGYSTLINIVGDGYESPWERTAAGWDPSFAERTGAVLLLAFFFIVLPVWALVIRRTHPGATLGMLLPWILMSLVPLMWSDAGGMLVFPILGIVTLVGALTNIAQGSVPNEPARPSTVV